MGAKDDIATRFAGNLCASMDLRVGSSGQTYPTLPKTKCWTTGRFKRHSASYILSRPVKTLGQFVTLCEISYKRGECSEKGPRFKEWIRASADVYMLGKGVSDRGGL